MKKIIFVMIAVTILFIVNAKGEQLIIPKEAIRFRVIANSNDQQDQENKILVRDHIQQEITQDLIKSESVENARNMLQNNLSKYKTLVSNTLSENNINTPFQMNYGMNYFPEKVYRGVKYEEGYYESLVVTLGNGLGNNWWCVLFPPLCLLEAEETEEKTEVEYKFFITELIDKYFK